MLNKKDINLLIKQVRLDSGLKQKDARKGVMSDVSYSKMENGKKSVSFDEIILILDNLQVSLEEFLTMYVQPILSESTRVKLFNYYNQLPSEEALESIFLMFEDLSERYPDISSDELGVYFDIKAIFHREWRHWNIRTENSGSET
ncbi:TPA: helix-turn-helix domain-containing protein [Enterococcus faecalis]|nr:helix-turn-helix domain-containing protein [Enterococcus faecalis]